MEHDRRRAHRVDIAKNGKILRRQCLRYLPIRSHNISMNPDASGESGMLIEVSCAPPLFIGERVQIVLSDDAVVRDDAMSTAVVVRRVSHGNGTQHVGLRLLSSQSDCGAQNAAQTATAA